VGLIVIPNRPSGSDTRSIAAILANFDTITNDHNGNIGPENIRPGSLTADLFVPGALGSATLAAGSVTTDKLAANAVTEFSVATGGGQDTVSSSSFAIVDDMSITVTGGDPVLLIYSGTFKNDTTGPGSFTTFQMFDGGSAIANTSRNVDTASFNGQERVMFIAYATTLSAGTHTIDVRCKTANNAHTATIAASRILIGIRFKR